MHSLPPSLHHIIIIVEPLKQKTLDEDEMNNLDSDDDAHIPGGNVIPYSRKYWRALNLAVEPKIAIRRILADLNLAVRYGIAIRIYASRKFWRILIWRL